ncbi:MAG TPA: MCP four helix bundle domain-containing protein, partial [Anaerolineales bacterium]|nr:MCP four helix bundle domain-containing protein [Anaerolineales bacterium]
MNILNNLKTNVKLLGSFMIVAALTAIVGGVGIYYLRLIDAADTRLYHNNTVPLSQLTNIAVAFQRTRVNLRDMLLSDNQQDSLKYAATIEELDAEIIQYSAEYEKLILTKEMQNLYDEFRTAYKEFAQYRDQIMTLDEQGKNEQALALMRGDAFASAKAVEADIDAMTEMKVKQAEETSNKNTEDASQATTILIALAVSAMLLAMGFGFVISRSIAIPLGVVTQMAQALSVGDLVRNMSDAEKDKVRLRRDEIGMIGKAFDALISYMQTMGASATAIANNDLTIAVSPNSEKDELGNAFSRMITGLRDAVGQVAESASAVSSAA